MQVDLVFGSPLKNDACAQLNVVADLSVWVRARILNTDMTLSLIFQCGICFGFGLWLQLDIPFGYRFAFGVDVLFSFKHEVGLDLHTHSS